MALFKVGDRVRVVDGDQTTLMLGAIGRQAVITAIPSRANHRKAQCDVLVDGLGERWASFWQLAPLTPPAADEWAQEKVKQVTRPIHEPIRTKEPA